MARTLRFILPVIAIIAITTSTAWGADSKEDTLRDTFKRLDKNNDGSLSKREYLGDSTGDKRIAAERRFSQLDENKNKQISFQEFTYVDKNKKKSSKTKKSNPKSKSNKKSSKKKK